MDDEIEKLPIYRQGMEIGKLVSRLLELSDPDNDQQQRICGYMYEDANNLAVKVAGAEAAELYDLKMENATIIRKSARELVVNTHGLDMFDFQYPEYYDLIRNEVEAYRLLFIDWVAGFDQWNYAIDRWGLFNPPGVGPHDRDPDDDIPFNPDKGL